MLACEVSENTLFCEGVTDSDNPPPEVYERPSIPQITAATGPL